MASRRLLISVLAFVFLVNSCALLPGTLSEADYEFEQGLALFNRGRYEDAIPRFRRATDLDPDFGRAYLYLGRSYVSLQRWRLALPPLRAAYRLSPGEAKREAFDILIDALFAVGVESFRAGDFPSAIGHFREVLELQPASTRARGELVRSLTSHGGALLTKGSVNEAISAYSEAVKLTPTHFDALFGLARAYLRSGDFFRAFQTAQEALKIDPGSRDLQSLMQQLKK
jgi:tetratricopeptide (TPR) repeat protein